MASNDQPAKRTKINNMNETVEDVLNRKYPAKAHAQKVVECLRRRNRQESDVGGVIYLEGQKTKMIEDSDQELHFRYLHSSQCWSQYSITYVHTYMYAYFGGPSSCMLELWVSCPPVLYQFSVYIISLLSYKY